MIGQIRGVLVEKKPPEILAKHPLGKVPYLETPKDGVIFDSTVINEYLDDRYPNHSLKPKDAAQLARMRMLENFADEALLVGELPKIWMPMWSKPEDRDENVMESGRVALREKVLPYIEQELEGRDYLCGAFSLADAPFLQLLHQSHIAGVEVKVHAFCWGKNPWGIQPASSSNSVPTWGDLDRCWSHLCVCRLLS